MSASRARLIPTSVRALMSERSNSASPGPHQPISPSLLPRAPTSVGRASSDSCHAAERDNRRPIRSNLTRTYFAEFCSSDEGGIGLIGGASSVCGSSVNLLQPLDHVPTGTREDAVAFDACHDVNVASAMSISVTRRAERIGTALRSCRPTRR
jgi:hypothetical protein